MALINSSRPYAQRSPVAKFMAVGRITVGGITRTIWGFMSFYNGLGRVPTFAHYEGLAPVDEQGFLAFDHLPEGVIIVEPGLMYKPIPALDITGKMMEEHNRAMKKWKPKTQLIADKSDAPAIDLGAVNLSSGTETIQ